MRVAIAGASGFVGSAVDGAARARGWQTVGIVAPRIEIPGEADAEAASARWSVENPSEAEYLVSCLRGADALVNAAGMAEAGSDEAPRLNGANGVLPAVLAAAAAEAGVRRLVHVSSAAVQGRRPTLDETPVHQPFSPYSRSKALGERLLLDAPPTRTPEVVIYRPTSVQGDDRPMTERLVRLACQPLVPVWEQGRAELPLALVENVGAAAVHLVAATLAGPIVLHPWEGMTVRLLFEAFGGGRGHVSLPGFTGRAAVRALAAGGALSSKVAAAGRRLELLAVGQAVDGQLLRRSGFELPVGTGGYVDLGTRVRARLGRHPGEP